MNIEEQFNLIAREYDANRKKFIPCFDDYYENTTKLITSNIDVPKCVLDLGAGTGLLTYYWFKECKTAKYVLVDIADDIQKAELFNRIYEALPTGGVFVNYDQFCAGTPMMNRWFDSYWEMQLYNSGLTDRDIELWKERRKLDRECTVEEEVKMLHQCTFADVKCLYSYHKFSVIIAVK